MKTATIGSRFAPDPVTLPNRDRHGLEEMRSANPDREAKSARIEELLFEKLDDAVLVIEKDGQIVYANRAARCLAGRPLQHGNLWEVWSDLFASSMLADIRKAADQGHCISLEHGDEVAGAWTELRAFPIDAGFAILARNISERKRREALERERIEAEVLSLGQTMNLRVRERTAELEAANAEMEGFTYSVSHDLRAPLRAIISTSMMLLEDSRGNLNDQALLLLRRQADAAKKVGILIDELLQLSRMSRQKLAVEPLDLALIALELAEEMRQDGRAKDIRFEIEGGLSAEGDPRLLRFVLLNLMDNACKFSPRGGEIRISKKDESFFVSDDGIGFEMAYAHKLFLPFERLVNESEYPGTGIGLANVQRIVHRHGGRVWAESEPGRGATFFFTLGEQVGR